MPDKPALTGTFRWFVARLRAQSTQATGEVYVEPLVKHKFCPKLTALTKHHHSRLSVLVTDLQFRTIRNTSAL